MSIPGIRFIRASRFANMKVSGLTLPDFVVNDPLPAIPTTLLTTSPLKVLPTIAVYILTTTM